MDGEPVQVVGQFAQFSRVWFVILQADAEYRARPEDFNRISLRAANGANVPLSSLITTRYVASPKLVTRSRPLIVSISAAASGRVSACSCKMLAIFVAPCPEFIWAFV